MKVNNHLVEKRIYDRARDMISKRGLKGWNMDQLASVAGLTKPTLYKIISSKETLIERVITTDIKFMLSRMIELIEQEDDYVMALEKMLLEYPAFFENGIGSYMHEALVEYPAIEKRVLEYNDAVIDRLMQFIKKGISEGKLRDDIKPDIVFDLLRAVVHYNVTSGVPPEQRSYKIKSMFQMVMNGILSD